MRERPTWRWRRGKLSSTTVSRLCNLATGSFVRHPMPATPSWRNSTGAAPGTGPQPRSPLRLAHARIVEMAERLLPRTVDWENARAHAQ